jgi:hypothetical protein
LWRKLGHLDRRAAIQGIRAFVDGKERQFVKQAKTYLKDRAWEDAPQAQAPGAPPAANAIWRHRAELAVKNGQWGPADRWGPKPGEPGCQMPQDLQDWLIGILREASDREKARAEKRRAMAASARANQKG